MLEVSRSGYYDWLTRKPSMRERTQALLDQLVKTLHEKSLKAYGSPRIYEALRQQEGRRCSKRTVERSMRRQGLKSLHHRRFRPQTTDSSQTRSPAPNVLNQKFDAVAPNQKWVSDITYISTAEGWLYLCVVLDLFSRKVVGYATSHRIDAALVVAAFKVALARRGPPLDLIFHSDRGSQYDAEVFRAVSAIPGLVRSMSRVGNCYDNAVAESFFKTLKVELAYQRRFSSRDVAKIEIVRWIELVYNSKRLHSSLRYLAPAAFEARFAKAQKAAA